eukprot:3617619-Amphidinium_carterae.1
MHNCLVQCTQLCHVVHTTNYNARYCQRSRYPRYHWQNCKTVFVGVHVGADLVFMRRSTLHSTTPVVEGEQLMYQVFLRTQAPMLSPDECEVEH